MDELELLKKDWKKDNSKYPKLSYDEIYKMILKKSSSIVKWIFIISLLEFAFWILISFALKDTKIMENVQALNMNHILIPLTIISYIVLIYFFYLFYKNYKNIAATDSTKRLMENILKTRRTVKYYVYFNLASLVVGTAIGLSYLFKNDENIASQLDIASANGGVFKTYALIIIVTVLMLAVMVGILLLFYRVVYGILLKRLNGNYKELKKLEV